MRAVRKTMKTGQERLQAVPAPRMEFLRSMARNNHRLAPLHSFA
jgi:hypothetical protein